MLRVINLSKLVTQTLRVPIQLEAKLSTTSIKLHAKTEDPTEAACNRASKQAEMLRAKTPIGKLEEQPNVHPAQEKDPLPEFPGGVNPETGEVGGPKGPEPTRYGDWERKGRVTDF